MPGSTETILFENQGPNGAGSTTEYRHSWYPTAFSEAAYPAAYMVDAHLPANCATARKNNAVTNLPKPADEAWTSNQQLYWDMDRQTPTNVKPTVDIRLGRTAGPVPVGLSQGAVRTTGYVPIEPTDVLSFGSSVTNWTKAEILDPGKNANAQNPTQRQVTTNKNGVYASTSNGGWTELPSRFYAAGGLEFTHDKPVPAFRYPLSPHANTSMDVNGLMLRHRFQSVIQTADPVNDPNQFWGGWNRFYWESFPNNLEGVAWDTESFIYYIRGPRLYNRSNNGVPRPIAFLVDSFTEFGKDLYAIYDFGNTNGRSAVPIFVATEIQDSSGDFKKTPIFENQPTVNSANRTVNNDQDTSSSVDGRYFRIKDDNGDFRTQYDKTTNRQRVFSDSVHPIRLATAQVTSFPTDNDTGEVIEGSQKVTKVEYVVYALIKQGDDPATEVEIVPPTQMFSAFSSSYNFGGTTANTDLFVFNGFLDIGTSGYEYLIVNDIIIKLKLTIETEGGGTSTSFNTLGDFIPAKFEGVYAPYPKNITPITLRCINGQPDGGKTAAVRGVYIDKPLPSSFPTVTGLTMNTNITETDDYKQASFTFSHDSIDSIDTGPFAAYNMSLVYAYNYVVKVDELGKRKEFSYALDNDSNFARITKLPTTQHLTVRVTPILKYYTQLSQNFEYKHLPELAIEETIDIPAKPSAELQEPLNPASGNPITEDPPATEDPDGNPQSPTGGQGGQITVTPTAVDSETGDPVPSENLSVTAVVTFNGNTISDVVTDNGDGTHTIEWSELPHFFGTETMEIEIEITTEADGYFNIDSTPITITYEVQPTAAVAPTITIINIEENEI